MLEPCVLEIVLLFNITALHVQYLIILYLELHLEVPKNYISYMFFMPRSTASQNIFAYVYVPCNWSDTCTRTSLGNPILFYIGSLQSLQSPLEYILPYSEKFLNGFILNGFILNGFIFKRFENGQAFLKIFFSKLLGRYYSYINVIIKIIFTDIFSFQKFPIPQMLIIRQSTYLAQTH